MPSSFSIPPLVRVPLKYGVIGGVLSVAFFISFYYFGKHPFLIPPFFDIRVLLIGILLVFGLKELRDYNLGGIMYFWQGMIACAVYLLTMAILGLIGVYLFNVFEPNFLNLYINQGLEQIKNIPPESIEQIGKRAVEEVRDTLPNTTISTLARKYTGQTFAIGFFLSIIISVILRRQPKTP